MRTRYGREIDLLAPPGSAAIGFASVPFAATLSLCERPSNHFVGQSPILRSSLLGPQGSTFISSLPIHRHGRPVDGARGVGGKEEDHFGNGRRLNPLREVSVRLRGAVLWRVDGGGHDAIHVDVGGLQLVGQGFSETKDSAPACAVGGIARAA